MKPNQFLSEAQLHENFQLKISRLGQKVDGPITTSMKVITKWAHLH